MKSLLINKLNKDREKFQISQRELLVKENQVLILIFLKLPLERHEIKNKIIGVTLNKTGLALQLPLLLVTHLSFWTLIVISCLFQDNQLCQKHLNQGKLVFISWRKRVTFEK